VNGAEVEARAAIAATLSRYTRHVDTGRAAELAGLFARDALYDMGGGVVARSRAEIVGKVEELKRMFAAAEGFGRLRHHTSSVAIDLLGTDSARAISYFVAFSALGPDHWGTYRDELVHEPDMWRFASRVVTVEGAGQGSPVRALVAH
jgi:hypothetical protein